MKRFLTAILLVACFISSSSFAATTIAEAAALLRVKRHARQIATPPPVVVMPVAYAMAEPSAIYSSIAPADIARVPAIFKVDGAPVGLLKWTAASDRPGDAVVGYEVQRDSGQPINIIYAVPAPSTEFPFTVGAIGGGMINSVAGEFWKVRAVFQSGARSAWAISQTWPERATLNY